MNRNKLLLIVLVGLLLAYLGNKYFIGEKDRNFRDELVELDTADVSEIIIKAKTNNHEPLSIFKKDEKWKVKYADRIDNADIKNVQAILRSLHSMDLKQLVANKKENWDEFEVSDSLGTQVMVYADDEQIVDLIIGRFSMSQQNKTVTTFIRRSDELEVYGIDGFYDAAFNLQFNKFRNKTFITTIPENLTALKFEYAGDSSFVLDKVNDKWQLNGTTADSTSVAKYLNGLRRMNQRDFADDFSPSDNPIYTLTIAGNNMDAIVVKGFMKDDEIILNSSLNPDVYFKKGSLDVFEKLFMNKESFITKEE